MDLVTRHTFDFVLETTPPPRRLLEVGCGSGALAVALINDGYDVLAIDSDEAAVNAARVRGVDARAIPWLGFEETGFDVVLFVRALHHLEPHMESVRHISERLSGGGVVLAEDFAFPQCDPRLVTWFVNEARPALAATRLLPEESSMLDDLLRADDAVQRWNADKHQALASETESNLRACFNRVDVSETPYFFRYFASGLQPGHDTDLLMERFLREEREMAEELGVSMLGRRFVASGPR